MVPFFQSIEPCFSSLDSFLNLAIKNGNPWNLKLFTIKAQNITRNVILFIKSEFRTNTYIFEAEQSEWKNVFNGFLFINISSSNIYLKKDYKNVAGHHFCPHGIAFSLHKLQELSHSKVFRFEMREFLVKVFQLKYIFLRLANPLIVYGTVVC